MGIRQAKEVANFLRKTKIDAIFSSNLTRAKKTAKIIAFERKIHVQTENLLRERTWGSLEGKNLGKIARKIRKELEQLSHEGKMKYKPVPDAESWDDAASRLTQFLLQISASYVGKTVLIVSHGNIMRALLVRLGYAKYDQLPVGSIKNTGYFILKSDGKNFILKKVWGVQKEKKISLESKG